ncbi:hypothetical protein KKD80_03420 [Patescibacteria group bacterium]|nr:hypothetical protein [Patescibacteria group bacterium]
MDTQPETLKKVLEIAQQINQIFHQQGVSGHLNHLYVGFDTKGRGGVSLSWALAYADPNGPGEDTFPPYRPEVTLWDESADARLILICYSLTNDSWQVHVESLTDEREVVHNLATSWALARGVHTVREDKAFELISELAAFYVRQPV